MSVTEGLKELAGKLQKDADNILAKAEHSPALFNLVTDVIAGAIYRLEKAAEDIADKEPVVVPETLEAIAFMADALDDTDDDVLRKRASLLDELLLTIATPKNAVAQARQQSEDELNKLRDKYRAQTREDVYGGRDKERNGPMKEAIREAVKEQVKEFRPLEAPLQTRYCPDHPGVGVIRIADRVYQCALDKKIYNWESGFTTMKGNKIPGGGVEYQVQDMESRNPGHNLFDTRQTMMSRFAQVNKDYDYGFSEVAGGKKVIEVRLNPGVAEPRKEDILKEIQSTMGYLYPIIFSKEPRAVTAAADDKKKA